MIGSIVKIALGLSLGLNVCTESNFVQNTNDNFFVYNYQEEIPCKLPVPADFVRMKDIEVTPEMGKKAVYYLNLFCKIYPVEERKKHYGEYFEFTTAEGIICLAHFEEHTIYGADPSKPATPHPSIGLFKKNK